jgi:hypothetical protein
MTHIPSPFMVPRALVGEWRRRADEYRLSDPAAAEAYARCADELYASDAHADSLTDSPLAHDQPGFRMDVAAAAPWLVAGGLALGVLGIARQVVRRPRRARREYLMADSRAATPPHGDKLLWPPHV